MKYAVIDPANNAGVAIIEDGKLVGTMILHKIPTSGKWMCITHDKPTLKFQSQYHIFKWLIDGVEGVIVEEGFGDRPLVINSQARYRGYIHCLCDVAVDNGKLKTFQVVGVSEWRRVVKEAYGISWPAKRVPKKALAVQLVKREFGIDVSDDEADAVLLFVASKRMGYIQ